MSLADPLTGRRAERSRRPKQLTRLVTAPLSALAFWSAITIPVLYLPLIVTGIDGSRGLLLFLGLFGLHVLSLIAGRSHRRPSQ